MLKHELDLGSSVPVSEMSNWMAESSWAED